MSVAEEWGPIDPKMHMAGAACTCKSGFGCIVHPHTAMSTCIQCGELVGTAMIDHAEAANRIYELEAELAMREAQLANAMSAARGHIPDTGVCPQCGGNRPEHTYERWVAHHIGETDVNGSDPTVFPAWFKAQQRREMK